MRKTITSRGSKRAKSSKKQNVQAHAESAKSLRTVAEHEAFYFYEDIGKPTGESAKSLCDFLDKIKTVKAESLNFHIQRKDFQNWIEKILDDPKLAQEIGGISATHNDIRMLISEIVQTRIKELAQSSLEPVVSETSIVCLPAT